MPLTGTEPNILKTNDVPTCPTTFIHISHEKTFIGRENHPYSSLSYSIFGKTHTSLLFKSMIFLPPFFAVGDN